ncbi:MAG: VWA domain-containing protein [Clostridia bacterium]|nr:VWA domain-containing protein [Clostridia bacterium]
MVGLAGGKLFGIRQVAYAITVLAVLLLSLSGCSSSKTEDVKATEAKSGIAGPRTEGTYGSKESESKAVEASAASTTSVTFSESVEADKAGSTYKMKDGAERIPVEQVQNDVNKKEISAGQLTAGEWSDLSNWEFWLNILNTKEWSDYQNKWQLFPSQRHTVVVKDGNSFVNDAKVLLKAKDGTVIWEARTNNKGQAHLFSNMFKKGSGDIYDITVEANGSMKTLNNFQGGWKEPSEIEIIGGKRESKTVDIMFVLDTTGSMGDELEYLKTELKNVIQRIKEANDNQLNIRISCNYYRDEGDEYVVRTFPFSENIDEVIGQISQQSANGGGDYEEAVEKALDNAMNEHQWSDNAKARLLFHVMDAPPHHNQETMVKMQNISRSASAKGIKIVPVASSGVDKNTEFLLRFLGLSTGGSYVFLTNHSGIGDSHIEPTIGQYNVEYLNNLLVRLVNQYIQ